MDVYSVPQLYILGVFGAIGSVRLPVRRDIHMVCPPEVWEPGDTIVLQCFVRKSSYPNKCGTFDGKKVDFRKSVKSRYIPYPKVCTLTNIDGNCDSTGDCRCVPGNSTYFLFEYEFTAAKNTEGYYDCYVECFDGALFLTFHQTDCDNRKVYALKHASPTPADCSSPNSLAIGLGVGVGCVVMAAVSGFYFGKLRSRSHQNAPPNNDPLNKAHPNKAHLHNAPLANAPQDNAPLANAPQDNAPLANSPAFNSPPFNSPPFNSPPFNSPPFNSPPDNAPQVAGQAGPSTGFASIPEAEPDEPSAGGSEASEGSEFSASGVGEE